MNLKTTLIVILSFLSISSFAFSYRDSIGVENLSGKKVIIYKLEPKDNYYSVGRKYGISPKIIMDFNKNMALNVGAIIRIPTQINFEDKSPSITELSKVTTATATETLHTVAKKETLYSISALYGMKMEDLKKLNKLTTNGLAIGKTLKVINYNLDAPTTEVKKDNVKDIITQTRDEIKKDNPKVESVAIEKQPADTTETNVTKEIPRNRYGITELEEKGTAVWIDDKNLDATKSYALHRTAPVGTIIKISNPMSGRSVFAKVVGRYTENETTKDVIIVVTRATAETIGVIDKRFFVNIGYGVPNNEK